MNTNNVVLLNKVNVIDNGNIYCANPVNKDVILIIKERSNNFRNVDFYLNVKGESVYQHIDNNLL
jgi:hypothetical protein